METLQRLFRYKKQCKEQGYRYKQFVRLLINKRSDLIELLPTKECLIRTLWISSVTRIVSLPQFHNLIKENTFYTLECPQKSKWTTLQDKLSSSKPFNLTIVTTLLYKMLVQELILKEKAFRAYWTPAYGELSEKLSLPIEIASHALPLNSSRCSLKKQEEKSSFWIQHNDIPVQKRNSPMTSFPSSISTLVETWEEENISEPQTTLITRRVKLKPTKIQQEKLKRWFQTSNAVYNRTMGYLTEMKVPPNNYRMRDEFVTAHTKKKHPEYIRVSQIIHNLKVALKTNHTIPLQEELQKAQEEFSQLKKTLPYQKNETIEEWEKEIHKDTRAAAVNDACEAYRENCRRVASKKIKHFSMGFRKKSNSRQSCMVSPAALKKNKKGEICLASLGTHHKVLKVGKRSKKEMKDIEIGHECCIVYEHYQYWLLIPIPYTIPSAPSLPLSSMRYGGVDPGVRTFMTVFGSEGCQEISFNQQTYDALDKKMDRFKERRMGPLRRKQRMRTRRRKMSQCDLRRAHVTNELHWKTIRWLLDNLDLVLYGDIKSHGIVQHGENKKLHRRVNTLKFFSFKQRLLHRARLERKRIVLVPEHYTTRTCSSCGTLNDPGSSKVYHCSFCRTHVGRDVNAAKNILMKGMILES